MRVMYLPEPIAAYFDADRQDGAPRYRGLGVRRDDELRACAYGSRGRLRSNRAEREHRRRGDEATQT